MSKYTNAKEKLTAELNAKDVKLSSHGKAVSKAVLNALQDFCDQNSEFAQAVMQSDKKVAECIESTVKGCGSSISDLEVYRRAVEFYFPGATVKMQLTIDLGDDGFSNKPAKPVNLSLDNLLDF